MAVKVIRKGKPLNERIILNALPKWQTATGEAVVGQAKLLAPGPRSGRLANSIKWRRIKNGVEVFTNVIYAAIHEFGGVIKPVTKKMLSFEIDGKRVFTKRVVIPARAYMRPAVDVLRKDITRLWNKLIMDEVKRGKS